MTKKEQQILEELAFIVHGGLATGHLLGAYYNYRRTGTLLNGWVIFHLLAALTSGTAIKAHYKTLVDKQLK